MKGLQVILFLLLATFVALSHAAPQRPNIVLILADDMGWNDIGFHGSEIRTPNLDALAYSGVILNNYYVSPICTPTRGALMTGLHPIHLGLQHYVISAPEPWGLPLNFTTMGDHFKRIGYNTHIVGKWHLGFFNKAYLPTNRGFDSHYGYYGGKEDYYNHVDIDGYTGLDFRSNLDWLNHTGYSTELYTKAATQIIQDHNKSKGYTCLDFRSNLDWVNHTGYSTELYTKAATQIIQDHDTSKGYTGLDFRSNLDWVNHTGYSTELYTKAAAQIIQDHNTSKPLFLYLAYQAVHAGNGNDPIQAPQKYIDRFKDITNIRRRKFAAYQAVHVGNGNDPIQAPQKYIDRFKDITNIRRRKFAGVVSALDDSVGAVVNMLQARGMMDNTIIVFSTDNGGPANNYDRNAACNFPLRGTKNTMWEGGVHGVGFVHSPFLQKPGSKSPNLVHVTDWLPTLYSAAGGNLTDLGQLDGKDLWNMIKYGGDNVRKDVLHNIDPLSKFSAYRYGDYKLVQGDISNGRNDKWYPCDPPKLNETFQPEVFLSGDDENVIPNTDDNLNHHINGRSVYSEPYKINCGPRPENFTTNCEPRKSPCLFHIPSDPCEYNNIAESNPGIVKYLQNQIDAYAHTSVHPVNKPSDPRANPANFGGVWSPWE